MPPCPRPASSATQWRTSPSSSPLHRSRLRQSGTSCPARSCCLHPAAGGSASVYSSPLPCSRHSSLQQSSAMQPPCPSRPPPNLPASVGASGPETDGPGMGVIALREEGRAENPLFLFFRHWPHGQWYPKP